MTQTVHRYVFAIEVLSENEINDISLDHLHFDTQGDYSHRFLSDEEMGGLQAHELLDESSAARALIRQGSDPEFFGLDGSAEPLSEEENERSLTNEMIMQFDRLYAKLQARGVRYTIIKAAMPPLPDIGSGFGELPDRFDPKKHCFREDSPTNRCRDCGHPPEKHTGCDCEDT